MRFIRDEEYVLEGAVNTGRAGGVELLYCYVFHETVQGESWKRRISRRAARYIIPQLERKVFDMTQMQKNAGSGSVPNPLWPSTTGNKSGGGRGNAPAAPSKGK